MLANMGCNLHGVDVPEIAGPSEEGFSIQLSLSKDVLVADDLSGALTGEKLLVGALTLSSRLRAVRIGYDSRRIDISQAGQFASLVSDVSDIE